MSLPDFSLIPQHWIDTGGSNVSIAILDAGFALEHAALQHLDVAGNKFDVTKSGFIASVADGNDAVAGNPNDTFHGTQMAGIISSRDETSRGIAPNADIILCKVKDSEGESYIDYFIRGLEIAVLKKVNIIVCAYTPTMREPHDEALLSRLLNSIEVNNTILVATNANTSRLDKLNTLIFPANQPAAILTATLQDVLLKKWQPADVLNSAYQFILAEKPGLFCDNPANNPPFIQTNWRNSHATAALAGITALYLSMLKKKEGTEYIPRNKKDVAIALKKLFPKFTPAVLLTDKTQVFYHQ